jgi:hypothetical protein
MMIAIPEQMSAESVTRLMKAKAADLNNWDRTIRNAVRAARRAGTTKYVGFTYTRFFIADALDMGGAYRFECRADGTVWRIGRDDS